MNGYWSRNKFVQVASCFLDNLPLLLLLLLLLSHREVHTDSSKRQSRIKGGQVVVEELQLYIPPLNIAPVWEIYGKKKQRQGVKSRLQKANVVERDWEER